MLTSIMDEIAAHAGPIRDELKIPALVERGRAMAPSLVSVVEHALAGKSYILGDAFSPRHQVGFWIEHRAPSSIRRRCNAWRSGLLRPLDVATGMPASGSTPGDGRRSRTSNFATVEPAQ